ncbi:MAG: hypothetical protein QOI74_12 [Micromonosporaceae bacterium]|nr:hypothetical protein [Micromonosporaceae bacterium]
MEDRPDALGARNGHGGDCVWIAPLSSDGSLSVDDVGALRLVNDVGEASFQNAQGFQAAVAVGLAACEQLSCLCVAAGLGRRDAV